MVRALVLILWLWALAGCYEDTYRCETNTDCNVGEGGRCEVDKYCTKFDKDCATGRRYQHAGANGDACFEDAVVPLNACAGGQAPAKREDCYAAVCERLPSCCDMAWTDACVQVAQEECKTLVCDTRIAITANRGIINEVFDLRYDGLNWRQVPTDLSEVLQWAGPAPDDGEPRLAGANVDGNLVVAGAVYQGIGGRTFASVTTIPLDRDRRDTLVITHNAGGATHALDIIKPHDLGVRHIPVVMGSVGMTWGDLDRDLLPDAVTRAGGAYQYLPSFDGEGEAHVTLLSSLLNVGAGGNGATANAPVMRSVDWLDLNRDTILDLVAFGAEIRVHTDRDQIRQTPEHQIDCDPFDEFLAPANPAACALAAEPNFESVSFGGAGLPAKAGAELLITQFPHRRLFRWPYASGNFVDRPQRIAFDNDACTCTPSGMNFDCSTCLPILAIVVRDLDGDHVLDIVVIDAKLNIFHALGPMFKPFIDGPTLPSGVGAQGFLGITVSVTGVPR